MKRPDRWTTPLPATVALLPQREMVARIEAARIGQPSPHRCPHCQAMLDIWVAAGRGGR